MILGRISALAKRLAIMAGIGLLAAPPLEAQTITAPTPPMHSSIDPNGVDLLTDMVSPSEADLSIGDPANGGLVHTRTFVYQPADGEFPIGGAATSGWRHGYLITTNSNGAYTWFAVSGGAYSAYFTRPAGAPYPSQDASGMGATLQPAGSTLSYTARDGTVINFDQTLLANNASYSAPTSYLPTTIVKPNGEVVTFAYKRTSYQKKDYYSGNYVTYYEVRLQSVSNNYGYMLKYSYNSNDPNASDDWLTIGAVSAINLAQAYCDPTADSCSGSWPTVSYSDTTLTDANGNPYKAYVTTLPSGRTRVYRHEGPMADSQKISAIKDPTSSNFSTVYSFIYWVPGSDSLNVQSVKRDGVTYAYNNNVTSVDMWDGIHYKNQIAVSVGTTARWSAGTDETAGRLDTLYIGGSSYQYNYDRYGRIQSYIENGVGYSYHYDDRGNILFLYSGTTVLNALYDTTCANPKTCNQPNSITETLGNVINFTYDAVHGGVLTATSPAAVTGGVQPQTRTTYTQLHAYYKDTTGAVVAAAGGIYKPIATSTCITTASCTGTADEIKTSVTYGVTGVANNLLPTSTTTSAGDGSISSTTDVVYDMVGNKISEDGPLTGSVDTSTWFYDADRRVVQVVGPDPDGTGPLHNRSVKMTYNSLGQVASIATGTSSPDGSGFFELNRTDTIYDSYHRKISQTVTASGAIQGRTDFGYDTLDRAVCTAVRMNPAVFATLAVDGCTLGTAGVYGPDRISHNVLDGTDRVVKKQSAYSTPLQRDEVTYTYHSAFKNLVTSITDAKGNLTSFAFDNFGRLSQTFYPSPSTPGTSSTTDYELLTYDNAGHVTNRRLRDGKQISYTYDNLGRQTLAHMVNPVDANDRDVATSYDLLGRVTAVDDGAGKKVSFAYDALGRKLSESPQLTGGSIGYQYDAAGRRTRLTWSDGFYVTYDYDTLGELLAIRENGAASGPGVLASFAYDEQGKPTGLTRGNGVNSGYVYDAASRLQTYTITHPSAGNAYNYAYNPAGQLVSRGMTNNAYAFTQAVAVNHNYTTNGLNQYTLNGAVVPTYDGRGNTTSSGSVTYAYDSKNQLTTFGANSLGYDATGRLATQATPATRFVYDGSDLIAETDGSNAILRRYVHIPGSDNVLVWYEGADTANRRWLAHDERTSTTLITDASGASLGINAYDDYGIPQSTNIGRFQYTGQTWLPELGMYNYKARIYSPSFGRFMQTDPIGYDDGPNWYNYTHGDPVNGSDASGQANYLGNSSSDFTWFNLGDDGSSTHSYISGGGHSYGNPFSNLSDPLLNGSMDATTLTEQQWADAMLSGPGVSNAGTSTSSNGHPGEHLLPGAPADGDGDSVTIRGPHWVSDGQPFYFNGKGFSQNPYHQFTTADKVFTYGTGALFAGPGLIALGGEVIGSIGIGLASTDIPVAFKTAHYAPRLVKAGVDVSKAEQAVLSAIQNGGGLQGSVTVGGQSLLYRGFLINGQISVGTIHIPW